MNGRMETKSGFNQIVLTLDIDWAPDFIIESVASRLLDAGVKATWLVTHSSPAVEWLATFPDLFELGIHPNFDQRSTHGESPDEVIEHCMALVPEALTVRTHGLIQSTNLLEQILSSSPIRVDVSLFLPGALQLSPVVFRRKEKDLLRLPIFWEDDFEMEALRPSWRLENQLDGKGLKIFNFHPIHVYLNSCSMVAYEALKSLQADLSTVSKEDATSFTNRDKGAGRLFSELVDHLNGRGESWTIGDIYREWRSEEILP